MAANPQQALVQLGRGRAYPFRVVNGGVAWNAPAEPSVPDVEAAIRQAVRLVVEVQRGECFIVRSFGSGAAGALNVPEVDATREALLEDIYEAVGAHVPWVIPVWAVTGFDDDGALVVNLWYRLARSQRQRSVAVSTQWRRDE